MNVRQALKKAGEEAGTKPTKQALANVFASGGKDSAITPQAIGQWGKKMPLLRQYQLREIRPEWFKDA